MPSSVPMTMMDVRPMAMDVVGRFMNVLVGARLTDAACVRVEMMQVPMAVGMRVNGPLMAVSVRMLFTDHEGDGDDHQQPGSGHRPAEGILQEYERGQHRRKRNSYPF